MDILGVENAIETTSQLELLEFMVGKEFFGINIAKVSEIIIYCECTKVPSSPPEVEGVFMHRDKLVTVIDLHKVLNIPMAQNMDNPENTQGLLIVCDFDQLSIAFHVTNVNGIQRFQWSEIEKPPAVTGSNGENVATGVAKLANKIIMILDFEKIVCDLNSGQDFDLGEIDDISVIDNFDYSQKIIVVEDSLFLNKVMVESLNKFGYTNISTFYNGRDAWAYIDSCRNSDDIKHKAAAVITDIEMPQMDGHTLVNLIKNDKQFGNIPVIIFSSLIHDNLRKKGDSMGADAQFSRSQLQECLKTVTNLLHKK